MPTTTTVTSNYAGKAAGAIIGASFKEADTISRGLIEIAENVNNDLNLRRIRYTDGTTAYSCGFTPAGAIVLNERVLTPVKLKNDLQVCKEDFRATWSSELMGPSAHNKTFPGELETAIVTEMLSETAERTDSLIWTGDNSNTDEWDGFITLFEADASVIKANNGITAPAAATTSANVLAHLAAATSAIPVALRRKKLIFAVSPDVGNAWMQYLLQEKITNGFGSGTENTMPYGMYQIDIVNGLPDNTIVIYEKKNLIFGTGLKADFNEVAVADEDEIGLMTGMVRLKMVYNGAVNYYNSEDIVYLKTDTAVV